MATPPYPPERLALFERCLDDGWSFQEISRTHGVSHKTLMKYFPGRQMSREDQLQLSIVARQANRLVKGKK